jgi:hypothetical protein
MANKNRVYIFAPNDITELPNGTPAPRFTMDLVEDFTPRFTSEITKYKVSDKSNISNHRFKNNLTISLSGYVSTRPIIGYQNNLIAYDDLQGRPKSAYELIKRYDEEGTELTIVNKFDFYPRCQIKSFTPIQVGEDTILITLELEQVRRASYQRVQLIGNMSANKKKDANPNVRKNDKKEDLDERDLTYIEKYKRNRSKTIVGSEEE